MLVSIKFSKNIYFVNEILLPTTSGLSIIDSISQLSFIIHILLYANAQLDDGDMYIMQIFLQYDIFENFIFKLVHWNLFGIFI